MLLTTAWQSSYSFGVGYLPGSEINHPNSACAPHKPCYNRARLETPQPSVKRKNTFPAAHQQPYLKIMSSDAQLYLKIGDVARLVGISPSAIRGWEALGLTHPHRTESRYRLYANDDVRLLKKARYLRKVRGLNAAAIVQTLKREGAIKPAAGNGAASIGPRLRRLRAKRGVSLAEVAAAAGISIGFLSALERSQMSASVGTLRRLARYYRTNILDFFDATESNTRLVRPPKRKVLEAGPGVRMELLAWGNKVMEPHLFRIAPQAGSRESYAHEGEEFLFVLRGELKIDLDAEDYHLKPRDTFSFHTATPHHWKNPGRSETWLLWVNTPPTF